MSSTLVLLIYNLCLFWKKDMKSAGNLVLLTILKKISISSQNLLDNSPNISKTVQDFFKERKKGNFVTNCCQKTQTHDKVEKL